MRISNSCMMRTVHSMSMHKAMWKQITYFLGKPFLKHTVVSLDYAAETATFYALSTTTKHLNWTTIGIVFGCVVAFAATFFNLLLEIW